MDVELSLDNILGADEIDNLFTDVDDTQTTHSENGDPPEENKTGDNNNDDNTTEVVDVDSLFTDGPESVGGGKENKEEKEDTTPKGGSTSPKNFYSSIAKALKEEGIFPDLDDEGLSKITKPEDFRDLIDKQIQAGLEERQKRVDDALNAGIEPTEIKKYENAIGFLESINNDAITDESDKGEELRKNLIYQDYINRGYSKERASREVQKSFNAGTDIDDAKEALKGNLDYFNDKYKDLIKSAKSEVEQVEKQKQEQAEKLKSSILNDQDVYGDISIDKSTRQKIYDNISKPVYKDPNTGEYLTAIQKYERDNSTEFLKNVGLLFTLTNGFKNLDGLVKSKVRKEVNKGLRELEHTLNNTSRTADGNLKFISGVDEDPESFIGKGWNLDV